MAHERMFDFPGNNSSVQIKFNALYIWAVHLNGTTIVVEPNGGSQFSFDAGSAEAAQAAYDLWVQRAEDAR